MLSRIALILLVLSPLNATAALLLARNSEWKYFKGTSEASNPTTAWRAIGFNDTDWDVGDAPIRYGDGNGGTNLTDMRYNYTTVFMRRTFNVTEVALISRLDLLVDWDDGYTIWMNGTLVHSQNPPNNYTYNATAGGSHESGSFQSFQLANPQGFLREGENTIAIQVFNVGSDSSDLMMNPELVSTAPDSDPPTVISVDPTPGNVMDLSQITVTFSEPVTGVGASDLNINGSPAQSVAGSGDQYTFTFPNVAFGTATVQWTQDHRIADTAVPANAFDSTTPGEVRNYLIVDEVAPVTVGMLPPPNLILRDLQELSVTFSEPVTGVDAGDLLAGNIPATAVSGSGVGPYAFSFAGLPAGPLNMSWANGHGITDLAADPNAFAGGTWSYTIDPDASLGNLSINEFIASNRSGMTDEDGEASDWIELYNFGVTPLNIAGWALSDDRNEPSKFVLPDRRIPAGGFLVIFASGKDRTPAGAGEIHTNFKLAASSEYLGLFTPELPRAVADELAPEFPIQRNDHSYGRDNLGTWRYYASPTPGRANGNSTISGLLEPPHPNVPRGFYSQPFNLHLTSSDRRATIRYTTNGSEPTASNGTIYSSPIRVTSTRIIRAAAFQTGFLPSETITHSYFYNASSAIRSLPVVSLATDNSNLWGSTGIQETNPRNTNKRGIAWERPVSAELIKPDNSGFHENCGLRVQGGDYVRGRYNPNGGLPFSKYSFRLYFRGDYGPTMLHYPFFEGSEVEVFDRITLRAGMNDHSNPFIVDEMERRMQIESGNVGARGNFVNLFINGDYKGYYNATERIDDDFMRSWHGGDSAWDVIAQFGEVREGDSNEWNNMRTIVGRDMTSPTNYQAALQVIDADNFIDYLLANVYGGTGDWPHNNWRAARERVAGAKFRFYVWDAEWSFGNQGRSVNGNTLTGELGGGSEIARLYQSLVESSEFRLRWADRVHKLFFNGGPFEDARNLARYEEMKSQMSQVLPGLSTSIRTGWIPNRRNVIIQHMKDADLYRSDHAPVFNQMGGPVAPGYQLTISASRGTIYYTTDGSDPRVPVDPNDAGFSRILLPENASKRVLVPTNGNLGATWTGGNEPFNDNSWILGSGAVGYDEQTTYENLIDIDVEAQMNNEQTSCYIRIPFQVTANDLADVNFMQLKARYDDGFAAYLNGVRIIGPNAPASLNNNSQSDSNNPDTSAVNLRAFNVSDFLDELNIGSNILAIHGLNDGTGSSDFLNSVLLEVGENFSGQIDPSAVEYSQPITVIGTTHYKARTISGGVWSALTEATFLDGPDVPSLRISEIMYNPDGASALEFLELQNTGNRSIDLGRMKFQGIDFTFREGTTLAPGERIVLISNNDPTAFAAHYPAVQVFGTYAGSLSNGGERLALVDGLGNTIHSVHYDDTNGWATSADGGGHSLTLLDPQSDSSDPTNWTASSQTDGSPGAAEPNTSPPAVIINEVLADNQSAVLHAGQYPAMIELRNVSAALLPLDGWGLSNDGNILDKFTFPAGTQINSGGYLAVWSTDLGFDLNPRGDTLYLSNVTGDRIDALSFGPQLPDSSLSRLDTGWFPANPTPASANGPALALAPQSSLSLNEWVSNRVPGEADWLELYNNDATRPVALRDLYLRSGETTVRYAAHTFLPPHGFLRLWADEEPGPRHLDFRLQAAGGNLALLDSSGVTIESLSYSAQQEDVSSGRYPDGSTSIRAFDKSASPGASNYLYQSNGILINELQAESSGSGPGWIELRNSTAQAVTLTGYSLVVGDRDGPRWTAPDALSLSSGELLLVSCDASRPASATPGDLNSGRALSPHGGEVYLFNAEGRELDRIHYGAQAPGFAIGRSIPGNSWTLLDTPTAGAANSGNASLGSTTNLRINEWLANSAAGEQDFVELFNNSSTQAISLGGLRLTDDLTTTGSSQFAFPALSYLGPQEFLLLIADGSALPGHLPFSLDALGETLRLYQATGTGIINEVTWGVQVEGISSGRLADGGATIGALPFQSPGISNTSNPNADSDRDEIPDRWESDHGLDPNSAADAVLDADGDQRSNLYEYRSNTDPHDPADFLTISATAYAANGFTLGFTARPGVRYTIEQSGNGLDWIALTTIASATTTRTESFTHPGGGASEYYRLVAERSP